MLPSIYDQDHNTTQAPQLRRCQGRIETQQRTRARRFVLSLLALLALLTSTRVQLLTPEVLLGKSEVYLLYWYKIQNTGTKAQILTLTRTYQAQRLSMQY